MVCVLVADIGGTNVRFSVFEDGMLHDIQVMQVADYANPAMAAQAYISKTTAPVRPHKAVFAVAGPVTGEDEFELTNHPWKFSITATCKAMGFKRLDLINDFHALALGILDADQTDIKQIGGGTRKEFSNIGVIGPVTGLGVATLVYDHAAKKYVALPGEGSHVTAPATTQREFTLFQWLMANRYSHVSAERVCSGKGLVNLYDAIRGVDGLDLPDVTPAEITEGAITRECPVCREAVTLMLAMLGRVAGNLALTNTTRGGMYFAGGILPKLGLAYLQDSRLRGDFTAKGRFTAFVDQIPTYLIDDPFLALRGLGTYAQDF